MDLRGRAQALRSAERLSAREIGERLGVPRRTVATWLKDLPVPEWTGRPNAKDGLRERAVALRAERWSVPDIARELGVSRSTAWLWVRDRPLDPEGERAAAGRDRRRVAHAAWAAARREEVIRRRESVYRSAAALVADVGPLELIRIGALVYWCEGAKAKPWSSAASERIAFINSDVGLVRVFLQFLHVMGVSKARLRFRVAIHETADAPAAVRWWAKVVDVAPEEFQRTTVKRSPPRTNRRNTGADYRGCLVIHVLRSRELYWTVEGIVAEVVRQAGDLRGDSAVRRGLVKLALPSAVV